MNLKLYSHVLFCLSFMSAAANAEETLSVESTGSLDQIEKTNSSERVFYPSTTSRTRTLGNLKFGWQPTPGKELDDLGWIQNNLSLGIGDNFEIGIFPLHIISAYSTDFPGAEMHNYQGIVKYNFIQRSRFNVGVSYWASYISFKFNVPNFDADSDESALTQSSEEVEFKGNVTNHAIALLTDYWISSKDAVALNINYAYQDSSWNVPRAQNKWVHVQSDYMHQFNDEFKLTAGLFRRYGYMIGDFSANLLASPLLYGSGLTATWVRKGKLFSSPSVGAHHYINRGITQYTFGTGFY